MKSASFRSLPTVLLLLSQAMPISPASAQSKGGGAPASAQSQLDLHRPDGVADLNGHLARLAQNPRDVAALIGAGEAALGLNDPRAATGFFARADEIESGNGRIKAGLGRAMVEMRNPGEALKLFDQATRLGYPDASFVADRGLAKDLMGNPKGAQQDYMAALRNAPDDNELTLRLAVSLGISGDVDGAEKLLKPLLYKSDRAAWRDRAFIMAMNGRKDEARDITTKTMPKALSDAIQPYMDKMAALSPAQRAAAVHFGVFPTDAQIRTAARSAPPPQPAPVAPAAVAPVAVAKAAPRETAAQARARRRAEKEALLQQQAAERVAARQAEEREKQARVAAAMKPKPEPAKPVQPVMAQAAAPRPAPTPPPAQTQQIAQAPRPAAPASQVQGPPAPGFSTQVDAATPSARAPEPTPPPPPPPPPSSTPPAPNPEATRTLADIMRELKVPEEERRVNANAVNLVQLEAIQTEQRRAAAEKAKKDAAAKAKAAAAEKAKAQAAEKARLAKNPSRNWVQVGTGRDLSAVAFTMKGLRKKYDLLAKKDAFTASWGRTNRLVVGPFASFAKAKDFADQVEKAGADAFAWQSDAGEEVDSLGK